MDYRNNPTLQPNREIINSVSAIKSRGAKHPSASVPRLAVALIFCALLGGAAAATTIGRQQASAGITKASASRKAKQSPRTPAEKFDAKQVGLQLYSLRREFAQDVPGTLAKVRRMGVTNIETAGTYNMPVEKFRQELDKAGLKPVSAHFGYERLRDDLDGAIKEAKTLGVSYVATAWIPHKKAFTIEECQRAIGDFNSWGEKLKANGLQFAYHIHGYEFATHGGGTLFDHLAAETKPEYVSFEMDVFWVVHGGADPIKLMQKYPNRFALTHLKDMRKGTPTGLTSGHAPNETNVPLGTGQIDFPALLRESQKIGVKHHFIEDESVGAEQQIPQSLRYLQQVKF
ncbi:MAG: sugar phosphate isomerase/epimerase [Pyrinomonadaceae bacterium]|nr:sugar phosphate isomerase/epimerase [Pyrinomonadaceae bacterium]MBA3714599.1 sugar phosphate isomerase/epimerase [Pyrinomonadaceae bacterium]